MKPSLRDLKADDLEQCLPLVLPELPVSGKNASEVGDILKFWSNLLNAGRLNAAVVEDMIEGRKTIVGFAMSTFCTRDFAEECMATPKPYLVLHACHLHFAGRSPILSYEQIEADNHNAKRGLYCFGLHTCWERKFSQQSMGNNQRANDVREIMRASLFEYHCGYHLKRFFKEIYSAAELQRYRDFGCQLFPDDAYYRAQGKRQNAAIGLHDAEPYVIGLIKENVSEGNALYPLFHFRKPSLGLNKDERQTVRLAVLRYSNKAIAEERSETENVVRQRFSRICQRLPEKFWIECGAASSVSPNKTELLIKYVAEHPEELRP